MIGEHTIQRRLRAAARSRHRTAVPTRSRFGRHPDGEHRRRRRGSSTRTASRSRNSHGRLVSGWASIGGVRGVGVARPRLCGRAELVIAGEDAAGAGLVLVRGPGVGDAAGAARARRKGGRDGNLWSGRKWAEWATNERRTPRGVPRGGSTQTASLCARTRGCCPDCAPASGTGAVESPRRTAGGRCRHQGQPQTRRLEYGDD